ncbi:Transposon Tf2-7 polyprotein [Rhizoctonia solani]|uniref:Transposon Tf2-7 polyprotein n=1 Tax=Rhizoctonia solani TaxID=456999 RepID=A0A8H8PBR3_9AGAM|nr:Transposon Tf2-7 polyprotein [Rhizoctonia solani]QRW27802.1 Transposon Tf2-7 polyprotein [Rhizoctonia solani]
MSWLKLHNPTIEWTTKLQLVFSSSHIILGNTGGTANHLESVPEDLGGAEAPYEALESIPRDPGGAVNHSLEGIPEELCDYAEVFSEDKVTELPPHRSYDLEIVLQDQTKQVKGPVYPLRPSDDEELKRILKEQLDQGLIRPSKSHYSSPVIFVPKKNGKRRMCIDYRALNANTGAKCFTALDLKSGYNLVRIKEGDEWKTAFKTKYGLFEYLVMPFGLCNAPATFQIMIS